LNELFGVAARLHPADCACKPITPAGLAQISEQFRTGSPRFQDDKPLAAYEIALLIAEMPTGSPQGEAGV
jgi:hypothetical protein